MKKKNLILAGILVSGLLITVLIGIIFIKIEEINDRKQIITIKVKTKK